MTFWLIAGRFLKALENGAVAVMPPPSARPLTLPVRD
jgi:hypothetical protein